MDNGFLKWYQEQQKQAEYLERAELPLYEVEYLEEHTIEIAPRNKDVEV